MSLVDGKEYAIQEAGIVFDSADNAYVVLPYGRIVGASKASNAPPTMLQRRGAAKIKQTAPSKKPSGTRARVRYRCNALVAIILSVTAVAQSHSLRRQQEYPYIQYWYSDADNSLAGTPHRAQH